MKPILEAKIPKISGEKFPHAVHARMQVSKCLSQTSCGTWLVLVGGLEIYIFTFNLFWQHSYLAWYIGGFRC